jgi:secreted trypsin-like serine protease
VSIVILAQPITTVTPRAVATSCSYKQFSASTAVHLVGFGSTNADGTVPNSRLKEAMTQVVDPMCASGNGCNKSVAPGGEFVAGGGTTDSCFGDSGGPVYLDTDHGPIVVGAVSRGVDNSTTPCGGGGIYVRPDKVIEWIESTAGHTIAKDSCAPDPAADDSSADGDGSDAGSDEIGGCSVAGPGAGDAGSRGAGLVVLVGAALAGARRRRASRRRSTSC